MNKKIRAAVKTHTDLTDKQIDTMTLDAVILKLPIQIQKDLNLGVYGADKMKRSGNAYGGMIKKYARGGGVRKVNRS
jgi:hypothetical protein